MKSNRPFTQGIFCCLLGWALCCAARAQVFTPESKIKQAADELVAKTQPGYYPQLIVMAPVASVDPCNLSLCRSAPLPVTLVSFTGERIDESNVVLYWETGEEVNNDYFQLERSLNPALGFETVATVKGAGGSSTAVKYQSKDRNDHEVYTYYRLKQVDFDGSNDYSAIIAIKGGTLPLTVTAYPNPGQIKSLAFKITGVRASEQLEMTVYDSRGRIVLGKTRYVLPEGRVVKAGLPELLPGKYSVKIKSKNQEAVNSFVVIP